MENEKIKIIGLQAENVKRIKAVELYFGDGLTIIGGKNKQGKTSILDIIMSLILGEKYTPTNAVKDGEKKGKAEIKLNNGVVISTGYTENGRTQLKISGIDTSEGNQATLKKLFGEKALDTTAFLKLSPKEKVNTLAKIIDIDIDKFESDYKKLFDDRRIKNRELTSIKAKNKTMINYPEFGNETKSIGDLIKKQQNAIEINKNNEIKTENLKKYRKDVVELEKEILLIRNKLKVAKENVKITTELVKNMKDEDIEKITEELNLFESDNKKIQHNIDKEKTDKEEKKLQKEFDDLDNKLKKNRTDLIDAIKKSKLPIPGLSIENNQLTYKNKFWDCMSTAEQFLIAASIQSSLTPNAPILLIDGLESLDEDSISYLSKWANHKKVQIIGTMVSTSDVCNFIISNGMVI